MSRNDANIDLTILLTKAAEKKMRLKTLAFRKLNIGMQSQMEEKYSLIKTVALKKMKTLQIKL